MKKFGFALIVAGGVAYFWCSDQVKGMQEVPQGVEPFEALKYYPAARMEMGRYAGMALLATGLLLFFMPSGRA